MDDSDIQMPATMTFIPNKGRRDVSGINLVVSFVPICDLFLDYFSFSRKRLNVAIERLAFIFRIRMVLG